MQSKHKGAASLKNHNQTVSGEPDAKSGAALFNWAPKVGIVAWSFVGFVVAFSITLVAFSAVSAVLLPLLFAGVLAIIFKPLVGVLERYKFRPTLAAALIVVGLILLMTSVVVATVRGVVDQKDQIAAAANAAVEKLSEHTDALGISRDSLNTAQGATKEMAPTIAEGMLPKIVSGLNTTVAAAAGLILGAIIMYYLLKDGSRLRRSVVQQIDPVVRGETDAFIGDVSRILRDYGWGRTVMSAIVAAVIGFTAFLLGLPLVFTIIVVNFIGGYIPYIGAFLGGGLAVVVALGDGGTVDAVIMLLVVLASNVVLENFVAPKIMGRTLDIHPLVVLVVTALGGLLGGIVGLILAVPFAVILGSGITRLRAKTLSRRVA